MNAEDRNVGRRGVAVVAASVVASIVVMVGVVGGGVSGAAPPLPPEVVAVGTVDGWQADTPYEWGDLVIGPDGAVELVGGFSVGRVAPGAADVTSDWHPSHGWGNGRIALGPDGQPWYTAYEALARRTPGGGYQVLSIPGSSNPSDLAAGPDGNVWFTSYDRRPWQPDAKPDLVGRMTPSGATTLFEDDAALDDPELIVAGPDDHLWVANPDGLVRVALDGTMTPLATTSGVQPVELAAASDGVWITEQVPTPAVTHVALDGTVTRHTDLALVEPLGLAVAADGTVWVADGAGGQLVHVALDGTMARYAAQTDEQPLAVAIDAGGDVWFTSEGRGPVVAEVTATVAGTPATDGLGALSSDRVLPGHVDELQSIAASPDGSRWFTDQDSRSIGRLLPDGTATNRTVDGLDVVGAVAVADDGSAWFAAGTGRVGHATVAGELTIIESPSIDQIVDLVAGPDGAMWFVDLAGDRIGRITPAGVVEEVAAAPGPRAIVVGPDGALWHADEGSPAIGRVGPAGALAPIARAATGGLIDLTIGVDGAAWVVPDGAQAVERVTAAGQRTVVPVAGDEAPQRIVTGPDGNLWLSLLGDGVVVAARLTPAGELTVLRDAGYGGTAAHGLAAGSDGSVTLGLRNIIFRIQASCGTPDFTDVRHEHPFCTAITWMSDTGITTGFADGTFRPGLPVQRQALAAFLWRAAGSPPVADEDLATPHFSDVDAANPFYEAIQWMGLTGRSTGTPDPGGGRPRFEPGVTVSRQALAAFLWRDEGEPAVLGVPLYGDVPVGHRFYDAIQWLGQRGIAIVTPISPGGPGSFNPGGNLSRQALSSFLWRWAQLEGAPAP